MPPSKMLPPSEPSVSTKRVGRRPKAEGSKKADLSRDAVVLCAVAIAKNESLSDVSMVRLGRELGVAAGLIHYYMGSRDGLISAVINQAFKERLQLLPLFTGDWRVDAEAFARASVESLTQWPGMATYVLTENRFRLFQRVAPGETDYGLAYFDHIGRMLKNANFSGPNAAVAYHLLMLFISVIAAEKENKQAPGLHADFISGYLARHSEQQYPGAMFLAAPFSGIESDTTFERGLSVLLDGIELWRTPSC
ncbi:TetR/AcrR family transcriptional regulator C-terminal domain-containing protein [Pseudomonas sp.]|uniref:TetR/AcrR family transcriptional regulator n=1 Tax=Pseudomonas sp. TaxID=306 RepID=UPI002632384A|nr:TetR/AcrR family transcriptional regulator C-terminal domain-containing protein [Pseudomonas sp.]